MREENGLPKGWVWTSVGEIYDIVGGGTPSTSIEEYWKGDIAWITSADIYGLKDIQPRKQITKAEIENSATNLVPTGSLIVVTRVGLGKVALTKMPLCFSQDSQALIGVSSSIHPDYSLYYLSQAVQIFKYQNRGTTIAGVTKKQLSELSFALPPLPEQQRIVAAIEQQFSRLEAGVAALQRAQAKLKRYRAAVLKAAVEGNLTESWRAEHPATEPASQLQERILAERRAKWEADLRAKGKDPAKVKYVEPAKPDVENLPELPEGWCWATFEQISERVTVGHVGPMKDEYIEDGIPFLRSQNVRPNQFDPTGLKFISREFHNSLAKSALKPRDILVVRSGSVGTACVMPDIYEEANCSDLVIVKQPIHVSPYYAAYYMNSTAQARVRAKQVGIALTHFNTQSMAAMPLPLPPLTEQEQIVAEVERRLSVISQLEAAVESNLKRAERLRQSILKEAFAGRLVPQDPDDEPASVLLERIRRDREKRKHRAINKGRVVIGVVGEPVKIDVRETRQVELWESGE